MRIGSALTVLLIILVGSGYLLSDDIRTHQELNAIRQQYNQALQEIEAIQNQLNAANAKIAELNQQAEKFAPQILSLQEQVRQLREKNQTLKEKIAQLQQQAAQLNALTPLSGYLADLLSSPTSIAIFLPIVPVSMATAYILIRSRKQYNVGESQKARPGLGQRIVWAQLTEKEVKEVAKMRRNR